jgi:hypothetical protein
MNGPGNSVNMIHCHFRRSLQVPPGSKRKTHIPNQSPLERVTNPRGSDPYRDSLAHRDSKG